MKVRANRRAAMPAAERSRRDAAPASPASCNGSSGAPSAPAPRARDRMPLFGLLLFVIAVAMLAFPLSANALLGGNKASRQAYVSPMQVSKQAREVLPQPPAGEQARLALPYETAPQADRAQPARSGGPDEYGYVFDDNTEPGGPLFSWQSGVNRIDDATWARARNVYTTTTLDDGVMTATLPFSYSYYGTTYTQVHIGTNGNLHFGAPNDWFPDYSYSCLPSNNQYVPQGMVAPFWYDFVVPSASAGTGGVYTTVLGTSPNLIYVVEWRRVYNYNDANTYATFEAMLYQTGEIRFQYNELVGTRINGADSVIGIQNVLGNIGLRYSCYEESVLAGRAIRYRLRQTAIFSPSSARQGGAPGGTVVYTQTLQNQTGIENIFNIAASGAAWTTTVQPARTGTMPNGGTTTVRVSVQIPTNVGLGAYDDALITVSSDLPTPGAYTATAVLTTTVDSNGANFSPTRQSQSGDFGVTVLYSALLTNTSPITNDFVLSASGDDWPTSYTGQVTGIAPNSSAPITVSVQVPSNSYLGASDVVTITATGQNPTPGQYFGITVLTTTAGFWHLESSMPIARNRGAGVLFPGNGRVYALGGSTSNGNTNLPVEEYDHAANLWRARATLQVGVTNVGAATIGSAIYVPGGYDPQTGQAISTLQVYYPFEDRADIVSTDPMPVPRMGAGVTAANGKMYVIGGADSSLVGTTTVYEYDPSRPAGSRWRLRASMSYPRIYLAAATVDSTIYAVGGMPGAPNDMGITEAYDPALNVWQQRASLNIPRAGLALVGVDSSQPGCGGYLYALGGGWVNYTASTERYDPSTNSWQMAAGLNVARRSLAAAYSPSTYSLIAFGGWSGGYEITTESAECSGAVSPPTPTPTVTPCPMTFSDVTPSDYFYEAVRYLYCANVISGYADGTFRPYNNTTRGQLSKIIVLAERFPINTTGGPHFSDVPVGSTFYDYVETAYNRGIISGYADGTFRPNNDVTRGQLCKIVVVAEGWTINTAGGPHFSDVLPGSAFYDYVETAYNRGIISGYADGTFRPGSAATRGQISKIVYNAITLP